VTDRAKGARSLKGLKDLSGSGEAKAGRNINKHGPERKNRGTGFEKKDERQEKEKNRLARAHIQA